MSRTETPQRSTTAARRVRLDADGCIVVTISDGYRLAKGKVKTGDRFLNRRRLPDIVFADVGYAALIHDVYRHVDAYSLVIRQKA